MRGVRPNSLSTYHYLCKLSVLYYRSYQNLLKSRSLLLLLQLFDGLDGSQPSHVNLNDIVIRTV